MDDVVICGAGPAGCVAAVVLARAGVRVRLLDRAAFPRNKLCGDTVNPGTLAVLDRLGLAGPVHASGLRVDGMRLTGPHGAAVEGRYPGGLCGRALLRRDLDWMLLKAAAAAGAAVDERIAVRGPMVDFTHGDREVRGVRAGSDGTAREIRARVTIAADGRHSTIAFALGAARHPAMPRRWAIGAYFQDVAGLSSLGEMHVRGGGYLGIAPVPGGLANVCLVTPHGPADPPLRDPASALDQAIAADARLRDRFARARRVQPPIMVGPLAVDRCGPLPDGCLVAGDAAGFIDPITGDGLRFAVRGGELAAAAALDALAHGWAGVQARHEAARTREFGGKWRFNRCLRAVVSSAPAVRAAASMAPFAPFAIRAIIRTAGDVARA